MSHFFDSLRRTAPAAQSLGLICVGVLSTLGALSLVHSTPAQAQSPGVNLAALVARLTADEAKITALQAKTASLSVSGKDLTFTGVNVHVVDGTGRTTSTSGLGNLTIGYNARGNSRGDVRTGSHNLIVGDDNNYASYGGLVAGQDNAISARYSSVSGGSFNTASSDYASVSGGDGNTASGITASVSGGYGNTASGGYDIIGDWNGSGPT